MPFGTVLFDADNTLLDFSRSEREALRECLRARSLPDGEGVVARYSAVNDLYWKRFERGEVSFAELRVARFAEFCLSMGFDCDPEALADAYFASLQTKSFLMDGALDLCRRLHGRCRLYLITNGSARVQHGRFDACPLAPLFDGCFISEEMGLSKPDRAYFDAVAAAIPDFRPRDTLVVGDSLTSDIQGGIAAGLPTCLFNPSGRPVPPGMRIDFTVRTLGEIAPIVLDPSPERRLP